MPGEQLTSTEERVLRWWTDILPVPPGSAEDDFFDLGGESMHLVQFLQRVYDRYRVELPVAELFAEPFTATRTALAIEREAAAAGVGPDR